MPFPRKFCVFLSANVMFRCKFRSEIPNSRKISMPTYQLMVDPMAVEWKSVEAMLSTLQAAMEG